MIRLLFLLLLIPTGSAEPAAASLGTPGACVISDPGSPEYYAIDLVSTKRVTGSRMAVGTAGVTFKASPFGVSITPEGSYAYDLHIAVNKLRAPRTGSYVIWATTPNLDQVVRLGVLDEQFRASGTVAFNKFIVVVSLEEDDAVEQARWQGPIVLRGMSRSGLMHTMAGHGPYQSEPCAAYGYR